MSIPGRLGARIPILATATGLAYLANLADREVEDVLNRLASSESRWDTSPILRKKLPERLASARSEGYALADESYLDEIYHSRIWAVAVPIRVDGLTVAALSSLVLDSAGQRKRILAQIVPPLRRTADTIAGLLSQDAGFADEDGGTSPKRASQKRRRTTPHA